MERKLLQSYIYTNYGDFFVSTIHRPAISHYDYHGFYETLAWKINKEGHREGKIVADNSGALTERDALVQHWELVKQLSEKGL